MQTETAKKIWQIIFALIFCAVIFGLGFGAGQSRRPAVASAEGVGGKEPVLGEVGKTDFAPFWDAWKILDEKFVTSATTTTEQEKIWGAISGLASSYKDPYTVFMPPEETKFFESEISGNFEGVGMEIGIKDDILTVIAPLKGTPAERAGVLPGDKILKIGDTVSTNMQVHEAVRLIRGKRGTAVHLTIFREGRKEPLEIDVTRDVIDIPTIDTEVKSTTGTTTGSTAGSGGTGLQEDGVFVIRLYSFSAQSPRLFRDALRKFVESGSNKLLLDLRGNPGGYLEAAVDMASWFLPAGKIIVTEDSGKNGKRAPHRSRGYDIFNKNLKFVILVNAGSASASEILAGALQEHGVAKLVGTKTFGKGSVQEVVKLTPETNLKVTVARWLTPNGVSISLAGLKPDVEVKMTPEDIEKKRDLQTDKAIQLLTTNN